MDMVLMLKLGLPGVFFAAVVIYLLKKPPKPDVPVAHAPSAAAPQKPARTGLTPAAQRDLDRAALAMSMPSVVETPQALRQLKIAQVADLPAAQVQALQDKLRLIARPPPSMHKLLSADFLAQASSGELNELIMAEPQMAAKLLAAVNTPFYSLPKPLGSIGQAVTFLGMNTVRSMCMRFMLDACFKEASPEVKKVFEQLGYASACASELCFKLAQLLQINDAGALVTQVVLSFLGQQVSCLLLSPEAVRRISTPEFLDRTQAGQAQLGLCATEMGHLLMGEWALPANIISDVRDIDRVLITPANLSDARRDARLALCYLCVRLGERLAAGQISDFAAFDLAAQPSPDFFFLNSYLALPDLLRLPEYLHLPEVVAAVNRMAAATQMRQRQR